MGQVYLGLTAGGRHVALKVVRDQEPVPASDVFSLAGTIAYAATGRPPFGGGRIEAIIHRTLDGEIDLDGADPRVADLVRLCAAKEPADRVRLERLIEMAASPVALSADPVYRRLVGAPPPVPASLPEAVASGLVPPGHYKARRRPGFRAPRRSPRCSPWRSSSSRSSRGRCRTGRTRRTGRAGEAPRPPGPDPRTAAPPPLPESRPRAALPAPAAARPTRSW